MAEKRDYSISDIYQGGYSSLNPSYGNIFTGYRISASSLGAPTKPDTANQIQQVSMLLNQGIVPIEVGTLKPEHWEQIPKQQFKEINQLAKLTGAKISVHAPLIEPSGIDPQGQRPWNEADRELAERQLSNVVEQSIEMDSKGGMPITIHSAGLPGTEYIFTPQGKKVERLIVINRENGKIAPLEEEKKFYPIMYDEKGKPIPLEKGEILDTKHQLDAINNTEWINSTSKLIHEQEEIGRILTHYGPQINHLIEDFQEKIKKGIDPRIGLTPTQQEAYGHVMNAQAYLRDAEMNVNALFNKAYQFGTEKDKERLKKASKQYEQDLEKESSFKGQANAIQNLLEELRYTRPKLFVPIEDFAIDKSAKTFANVAFNAFDKHKSKAPVISIENLYSGMAFSSSEDMDKLINKSREEFVKKATSKGYSEWEARQQAEKLIGMTLDVGHLNIMRKKALGLKEKDVEKAIAKEVEQIAKKIKHIHVTDNFGYSDTHLAPGMGNVPFKKIFEELEKKGIDVARIRKISEAGGFVQQFGVSPFPATLEAMGSPIYSMQMAPYWNQSVGLYQGYFSGFGQALPSVNYETFGAGFAQLPSELGGQRGGAEGSRMSGRGME